MNVLIDASVWVDHFRKRNDALGELSEKDLVLNHPMVLVELVCGSPPAPRAQTLHSIGLLRSCNQARLQEVMDFIEREKLYGLGCGLVDMCLLTLDAHIHLRSGLSTALNRGGSKNRCREQRAVYRLLSLVSLRGWGYDHARLDMMPLMPGMALRNYRENGLSPPDEIVSACHVFEIAASPPCQLQCYCRAFCRRVPPPGGC